MIRFFDILFSFFGIVLCSILFLIFSLLIKIDSNGPIIYRQKRVGFSNIDFFVFKFRTMFVDADKIGLLTVGDRDSRVTRVGYFLRKYKLDELPQLFNVLFGSMSLVGPRPEVRKYVEFYNIEQKKVLTVKPGITDWASIRYRDENTILKKSINPEYDYINVILPDKIKYNLLFINNKRISEYFNIIFNTFRVIFSQK